MLAALTSILVFAPVAAASTSVSVAGTTLTVLGDGGDNVIVVTDPGGGNYGVTDTGSGATVSIGAGCASDGSGGALCPTVDLTAISISDPSGTNTITVAPPIVLPAALSGGSGADTIHGGGGNDLLSGGNGNDTLIGEGGGDELRGQGDSDPLLSGGEGDDVLRPDECGAAHPGLVDVIDGGPGANTVYFDAFGCYPYPFGGVTVSLDGVANDLEAGGGAPGNPDYPMNVLNVTTVVGGGGGADTIVGSAANETIIGNGDRPDVTGDIGDQIDAGGGDDTIRQTGSGDDLLDGGSGEDTLDFSNGGTCSVSFDGVENDGPGVGSGRPSNVLGFENAISCGGAGSVLSGDDGPNILSNVNDNAVTINGMGSADLLTGANAVDNLNGGGGDDVLEGRGGNDAIHGDDGDDTMRGGGGEDAIVGDAGTDLADYADATGALTVTLDGVANDGQVGEKDNVDSDVVRGGNAADSLIGGAADETLVGGPGADQLHGGEGADELVGGPGADLLDGQGGTDLADYSSAGAPVAVTLDGIANDGYAGEGDNAQTEGVLGGEFGDTLSGDGGANRLLGGEGDDQIDGLGGDDFIVGGEGEDALKSGTGADSILARDGEKDALTCDVAAGKTIEADPVDTATVCDLSAAGGPEPTPVTPVDPGPIPAPPGVAVDARGKLTPATLLASLSGVPHRNARLLLSPGVLIDLGELNCPGCKAKAVVRSGKSVVATGSAKGGSGPTTLTAALTASGRKMLDTASLGAVATISIAKGKVSAKLTLPLRLKGGKR